MKAAASQLSHSGRVAGQATAAGSRRRNLSTPSCLSGFLDLPLRGDLFRKQFLRSVSFLAAIGIWVGLGANVPCVPQQELWACDKNGWRFDEPIERGLLQCRVADHCGPAWPLPPHLPGRRRRQRQKSASNQPTLSRPSSRLTARSSPRTSISSARKLPASKMPSCSSVAMVEAY